MTKEFAILVNKTHDAIPPYTKNTLLTLFEDLIIEVPVGTKQTPMARNNTIIFIGVMTGSHDLILCWRKPPPIIVFVYR
jgi:hypothetical protein